MRRRLAGVFGGGGACKRDVDFFLREVLRLEERNALVERRAGDRWVLKNCRAVREEHVSVVMIATYMRPAIRQYKVLLHEEGLTAEVIRSSRTMLTVYCQWQIIAYGGLR